MDNHYHLLLRTPLANLDLAIKHLNGIYTKRFNKDVKRDGPLFRGRYKSVLVDKDSYLINLSRYIHKNPSTAKITNNDKSYNLSSYKYFVDQRRKPSWLVTYEILNAFSFNHAEYVRFVDGEIDEDVKKFYLRSNLKPIFGSADFIKKISDEFFKKDPCENISNRGQIISAKY